jgi:hypothetical protein
MDDATMNRLSGLARHVTESMAKDKTCGNCEHLASRQLSAILAFSGGHSTNDCGNCKNGSNFKARKRR